MGNVILLRDPSEAAPDRYEAAFAAEGFHPVSVPVLDTVHTNISNLADIVRRGPAAQTLSGVIITSKRSCEAWRKALQLLQADHEGKSVLASWESVPFYVVGKATSAALQETFSTFARLGVGSPDIRGESTGSAVSLAPLILNDLKERPANLLYLTGDKNRDTLPRLLEDGGMSLQFLQVYETCGSPSFPETLSAAISSSPVNKHWWVVYFAPSVAAYVTPTIRKHFHLEGTIQSSSPPVLVQAKVAAIGPTTDTFLQEIVSVIVNAKAI
ncbi:hypothetical protein HYPSUDRAFT_66868 [Hypholoma sublateritium FD-334 SS-4]|uniref:Tetrapyrrole biosynthesis uroporphyrinogen III synthase domain-containing protein n=1 Tax=Hypholoma sublateritium (strain FD-334 SS-4) TaxID=945553 RepID=A0A0D2PS97_HYPSF|nr:hypothetical protein HYPSUDRAFT_66868 [Hypholoma sublateritium FD-334 SS-4]